MLKPFGGSALNIAGTVVLGLLQFVAAIVVAGFLYAAAAARSLGAMLRRIFVNAARTCSSSPAARSAMFRAVSLASPLVQSFLAGLGFLAVGLPGAGFFTFLARILEHDGSCLSRS